MPPTEMQPPPSQAGPIVGRRGAHDLAAVRSVVAAIPARWASTRLPGKPLADLGGRPLIEHVYRRAQRVAGLERAVVLTDDGRIADAVRAFGGEVELTPADCASGTDRIAWAARRWPEVDAVVNIQGDEPLIDPAAVEAVAARLRASDDRMVTLAAPAADHELDDPNVVKVVVDRRGNALYFSRARIPFRRPDGAATPALKHVGLYGYRRDTLIELAGLAPTPLERSECLEQLRALENGIAIRVLSVDNAETGVDTPDDLARVAARLADQGEETAQ